jgi:hypothetical protein
LQRRQAPMPPLALQRPPPSPSGGGTAGGDGGRYPQSYSPGAPAPLAATSPAAGGGPRRLSDLRERMGQMRLSGGAAAEGGAVAAVGGGGLSRPNSARSSLNGPEMREMSSSFEVSFAVTWQCGLLLCCAVLCCAVLCCPVRLCQARAAYLPVHFEQLCALALCMLLCMRITPPTASVTGCAVYLSTLSGAELAAADAEPAGPPCVPSISLTAACLALEDRV